MPVSQPSDEARATEYDRAMAARRAHIGRNVTLSFKEPILMVSATGCRMVDNDGREWLDTVNNVAHVGHCEPSVVAAQVEQLGQLNTNARYLSTALADYVSALVKRCPPPLSVVYLCNSGSEANDLALQLALAARPVRRQAVAVMEGAYHGHSYSTMQLSPYKFWAPRGGGRPEWVHVLPMPDSYRCKHLDATRSVNAVVAAAKRTDHTLAAFFCESALSCAGQVTLPEGYLQEAFRAMRQAGAVCIADEVQCGLGRTGSSFWCFAAQGVVPDILVAGKALGNGFPLAAVITSPDIADSFASGPPYFNTFGGNNAACVSGLAVLEAIDRLELQQNALRVGSHLLRRLAEVQRAWPEDVGNVRGLGLFIGVEFVTDSETKGHAPGKAQWFQEQMKGRQVLTSIDGIWGNVLKIKPPCCFSQTDADEMVDAMTAVLTTLSASVRIQVSELDQRLRRDFVTTQQAAAAYRVQLFSDSHAVTP